MTNTCAEPKIRLSRMKTLLSVKKNYYLRAFLWALGLSFLIFLPWIIYSKGYFFFYGDFNVQQIPFYQMIHDSIRNGNIGWSYTTDLGANIIGSYSFYMMGSPFFYLTLLFPSEAVPYLMAPLLMLKFALASLGAYTFLQRYVRNQNYAVIGALLYAFSGFGIYNVFFNHFHEAMITFPFMLAAVDSFIYDRKKGVMAYAVFASCFVNYYFFAGQAVFVFIYWLIRMRTGSFRMKFLEFLRFAFEVIVGFGAAAVMLFPSVLAVVQNSRVGVDHTPSGWDALVYNKPQRYFHILESFFFPPDMPAYAVFTPKSDAKWASVAGWLPLFSMVGVFAFFRLRTHRWLRMFIPILFITAFVPFFNCFFQLMNATYYARWFYMLTLMLILATVITLDHEEAKFRPALKLTFIITAIIALLIGLMPKNTTDTKGNEIKTYGIQDESYTDRFWVWVGIAVLGLVCLAVLFIFRKKRKVFVAATSIVLSVLIVGYGTTLLGVGVVNAQYKEDYIKNYGLNNKGAFDDLPDIHAVRSDFYEEMDNMGMYWQIPTIQAFQSIVPGSVMEYYKSVGVERVVGSRPKTEKYAVRSFLSCKYLFDNQYDKKDFDEKKTLSTGMFTDYNQMPGWHFLTERNGYKIYENDYFIPYGFTYDKYITTEEYEKCDEKKRSQLMLKSIVLTPEQEKLYSGILEHDEGLDSYHYTQAEYFTDCLERRKLTCSEVKFENNSVTARITTGAKPELVFFSIPYENGWSVTVDGSPARLEKVNVGFMAVEVPAGKESTIRFTYETPGLRLGAIVTGISVVLFITYMVLYRVPARKRKRRCSQIDDIFLEEQNSVEENGYFSVIATELKEEDCPSGEHEELLTEAVPQDESEGEGTIEAMAGEVEAEQESGVPDKAPEAEGAAEANEGKGKRRKKHTSDDRAAKNNKLQGASDKAEGDKTDSLTEKDKP